MPCCHEIMKETITRMYSTVGREEHIHILYNVIKDREKLKS